MKVHVGQSQDLQASKRHVVTFRRDADYLCIVLFHLPNPNGVQFYAMINECPHMGASMEDAAIEIEESVVVCPLHAYDFDLSTGKGSSGLSLCTYPVVVQDEQVYIELEDGFGLVSTRPVSQTFPLTSAASASLSLEPLTLEQEPTTLTGWARLILLTANPVLKVERTRRAASLFRKGKLKQIGNAVPPDEPPREELAVVDPGKTGKRGKGNTERSRISLLHSLANIEQWAIDLAWDIICRFPTFEGKRMPLAFFSDFVQVAEDESKHFTLLVNRLEALGSYYGALPIHHGLWNSARDTFHSLKARLCIIHLVHESRGLDVNPTQIARMRAAGDHASEEALTTIHHDEITHVMAGHRWLTHLCAQATPPEDPVAVFRAAVTEHFHGGLKPPFNAADRAKAGLSPGYYENLRGKPVVAKAEGSIPLVRATAGG